MKQCKHCPVINDPNARQCRGCGSTFDTPDADKTRVAAEQAAAETNLPKSTEEETPSAPPTLVTVLRAGYSLEAAKKIVVEELIKAGQSEADAQASLEEQVNSLPADLVPQGPPTLLIALKSGFKLKQARKFVVAEMVKAGFTEDDAKAAVAEQEKALELKGTDPDDDHK